MSNRHVSKQKKENLLITKESLAPTGKIKYFAADVLKVGKSSLSFTLYHKIDQIMKNTSSTLNATNKQSNVKFTWDTAEDWHSAY